MRAKYKRVLLKISGEALAGTNGFGLDEHTIAHISENIKKIVDMGVQVSIVVGGETSGEDEAVRIWTEQELTIWVCLQLR